MDTSSLSPENVSQLIDHVLKDKDPATIGLRRILRRKDNEESDFPARTPKLEEFESLGAGRKKLTQDERRVLELEKQVQELSATLKKQQESARQAVQAAYVKGKSEGTVEGLIKGKSDADAAYEKKVAAIQEQVASFLKTVEDSKRSIYNNAQHILLRLCCELTKKLLCTEVVLQSDCVLSTIKKALSYISDREKLIIRIAPVDFETVSGRRDFWVPVGERLKEITIEQDERIERGGCIIESNSGIADARLGVQFSELADLVEKIWDNINASPLRAACLPVEEEEEEQKPQSSDAPAGL